jgi:hypothetical protein
VIKIDLHWWAERYRATNRILPIATASLMACLIVAAGKDAASGDSVRQFGLVMATAHGLNHVFIQFLLRLFHRARVKGAQAAISAYSDARCISHVDLCAAWLMFYLGAAWLI